MVQGLVRGLGVFLLMAVSAIASAEYAEECRELADKLSRVPGDLSVSEIDLMKTCLAGLQRSKSLGETVSPTPPPPEKVCPPLPPVVEKECPVCPPAPVCPRVAPSRDRERDREPAVDPLRPQLQRF